VGMVLGLLTALLWGASALIGAPGARALGPLASTVWVQLTGLAIAVPLALAAGPPHGPASAWIAAAVSGLAYVGGGALWTLGVTRGDVGLVTMLISTDGSVAALFAIILGERIAGQVVVPLLIVTTGIILATRSGRSHRSVDRVAVWAGLGGATSFAITFVAGGHATALATPWILLASRGTGSAVILPVAAVAGRIRSPRGVVGSLVGMAALDIAGFGAYILAARHGIAIAAVLASQYALIAVLGGRLVYGEHLARIQRIGIGVTLLGVALVAVTR
jgi:drug/metabolite transporter (DMT)-like permease